MIHKDPPKTHLRQDNLLDALEISELLNVQLDRAQELLKVSHDLVIDIKYFYKESGVRKRVKQIIKQAQNKNRI